MAELMIIVGASPVAVRQALVPGTKMAKAVPALAGVPLVVVANEKEIYKYGDDTTRNIVTGDAAGEFTFGLTEAVLILALHLELGVASVVDVTLTDADGTHPRKLLSAQSGVSDTYNFSRNEEIYLLPGQKLLVNETILGTPPLGADKFATLYVAQSRRM